MYKIGLARVFGRLVNRFRLTVLEASTPLLAPVVTPITNLDDLTKTSKIYAVTGISGTSTGHKNITSVPKGKRWRILGLEVQREASTPNLDSFFVRAPTGTLGTATDECRIYYAGSVGGDHWRENYGDLVLDEDWKLDINVSGAQPASSFYAVLFVEEEDAF